MRRPKIMTIVGTRPEAIKLAPVILELRRAGHRLDHTLVSTAQHRQMLDAALGAFGIRPQLDLDLMRPNQTLADLTARALATLSHVFTEETPDLVLVQGDTTTVMAAGLAAFYHHIPIGHVEAGLRTFNRRQPFPEETNRRFVSATADLHFAPTGRARENLLREGVPPDSVFVTGNTIVDALQLMPVTGPFTTPALRQIPSAGCRLLLVTAHRRENHGAPLRAICQALRTLARQFDDIQILYPVHPNPNVLTVARAELGNSPRIHLLQPLPYADLLRALARSHLILTDSGGIQEEAPSFHKPVLILRETTERPELVEAGGGRLVGTDPARIVAETTRLLSDPVAYDQMSCARNPFGDGRAARRIVEVVSRFLACGTSRPGSHRQAEPQAALSTCPSPPS